MNKNESLNPCFNGRYSRRGSFDYKGQLINVLILVLMEDTLGVTSMVSLLFCVLVLILVLMEDTLGVDTFWVPLVYSTVLILVLMEDTLGVSQ